MPPKFLCGWRRSGACIARPTREGYRVVCRPRRTPQGARASGIARRRTEEERAEAFFPLRATTTAADSKRDARAPQIKVRAWAARTVKRHRRHGTGYSRCQRTTIFAASGPSPWDRSCFPPNRRKSCEMCVSSVRFPPIGRKRTQRRTQWPGAAGRSGRAAGTWFGS